jgi:phosphoribosyl 1,2-cyclic phosphodiesterase
MRFTSLGSGSAGNALYVEQGTTRLLLDCGLPIRSLEARLLARHIDPYQIEAILLRLLVLLMRYPN